MGLDFTPGTVLRHYKGGIYIVLCTAKHTETAQDLVIYHKAGDDSELYARPMHMFTQIVDGYQRFTEV